MKKQIQHLRKAAGFLGKKLTIAILALSLSATAFANGEEKVSHWVLEKFNSTYADATEVNWVVSEEYAKANFMLDGNKVEAFFSNDGNFISEKRTVSVSELPQPAIRTLKKKYSNFMVKDVLRTSTTEKVEYQVSIESDTEVKLLKVNAGGSIEVLKSFKK